MSEKEKLFEAGRAFAAKKPRRVGFPPAWNDRQIVWVGIDQIQYDSPTVKLGSELPIISREKFEKWAGEDVTDLLPEGDWRT